jgi:hypothetical protein
MFKMQVGLKGEASMIYAPEKQGFAEWTGMQIDDIQSPFTWYKVSWLFTSLNMTFYFSDGIVLVPWCFPISITSSSSTDISFL